MIFINFPTKGLEELSLKALETELYKGLCYGGCIIFDYKTNICCSLDISSDNWQNLGVVLEATGGKRVFLYFLRFSSRQPCSTTRICLL